jgi:hypothetical protein
MHIHIFGLYGNFDWIWSFRSTRNEGRSGTGKITKSAGGGGTQNGALLAANMNDSSGNPIPLGASPNNKPGIPTIDYNGGGNSTIQYDRCWVNNVVGGFPLKLLSMRELIYR